MLLIPTETGALLHIEDIGEGEPIIALHGLLGTARVDLGSAMDALSTSYQVLGVTMRGYGASEPKPRTFPPNYYERDAADVLAAMDSLSIESAHIIGYSDGGEVALIAATQAPERFRSVITWGSMGVVPEALRPDPNDLGTVPGVTDISTVARELHGIADPEPVFAEWLTSYTQLIDGGGDLSRSQAHRLSMPVLLILGDQDPLAFWKDAEPLVTNAPNAQLKMISGGHALHEERLPELLSMIQSFIGKT